MFNFILKLFVGNDKTPTGPSGSVGVSHYRSLQKSKASNRFATPFACADADAVVHGHDKV
ncbi:MAG: hypothetical protein COA78_02680 [Blastopirellula sp.]|nr:MAG: hypothetical protein COA78_02680 [Blastopirellula sp.]